MGSDEQLYVWEITIPMKQEYKIWQALILLGIDIRNDFVVWLSDYRIIHKYLFKGLYADIIYVASDNDIEQLRKMLIKLKADCVDGWILEEYEEEN